MAPTCTPWSVSSNGRAEHDRRRDQEAELSALEFMYDAARWQMSQGLTFAVEQPASSSMFRLSPFERLASDPDVRYTTFDQCMFGAQDEHGAPMRKKRPSSPTGSGRKWPSVATDIAADLMVSFKVSFGASTAPPWQQSTLVDYVRVLFRMCGGSLRRPAILASRLGLPRVCGQNLRCTCVNAVSLVAVLFRTWSTT